MYLNRGYGSASEETERYDVRCTGIILFFPEPSFKKEGFIYIGKN
jgi:hypothetical protein